MADESRSPSAAVAAAELCAQATEYDFFQLLRRIEQLRPDLPRLGDALLPSEELIRAGQQPNLRFAPSAVAGLQPVNRNAPLDRLRLDVAFFGLFGPHGALPTEITEFVLEARERARREGRREPISDFTDIFHHRLLLLLQRVWAASRPTVNRDRPSDDHFAGYVAALFGALQEPAADRQSPIRTPAGDAPQLLRLAGILADPRRSAEGLEAVISQWLQTDVHVEPLVGEWLDIPEAYAWQLGSPSPAGAQELGRLGESAVLGPQVFERQHKFRLVVGPVDAETFEALSPRNPGLARLKKLVHTYVGDELKWDLRLRVTAGVLTPYKLGGPQRLGETSYLIDRPTERVVDHLLDPLSS